MSSIMEFRWFPRFAEILKTLRRKEILQTWPNMNSYMIKYVCTGTYVETVVHIVQHCLTHTEDSLQVSQYLLNEQISS